MTRTTRDHNLSTAAARARLKPRDHVYWRSLDVGIRIGYRRHEIGGRWVWSRHLGDGAYHIETIKGVVADDFRRHDGVGVLSYPQAVSLIRELASQPAPGPTTVSDVLDAYFARLGSKGKPVDAPRRRVELHVLPTLGDVPVDSLDRAALDPQRGPGKPAHEPTELTRRMVNTLSAVGFSQDRIAAHLEISTPTLRVHYRRQLDFATELMCGNALAKLVSASNAGLGMASVKASLAILCCRGGWRETSKLEVEDARPVGIAALKKWVSDADAADAEHARLEAEDELERARLAAEQLH